MAVTKNITFLSFLSDFWLSYYQDAPILDHTLGANAEVLKSLYFRFLQKSVPWSIQDMPIFQEQFWNVIEIFSDQVEYITSGDQSYFKYPLDEAYAHIPYLYNIVYEPTIVLKEYQDYSFERKLLLDTVDDNPIHTESYILFKEKESSLSNPFNGDPFTSNDIAKRVVEGSRLSITFFAPKVFIDSQDLYKEWGVLAGIPALSSVQYRDFLQGLFYLYIKGPTISALNSGLNVAAGYPVARQTEIIRSCEVVVDPSNDINEFILTSDEGNTYVIPRKVIQEFDQLTSTVYSIVFPRLRFSNSTYTDITTGLPFSNVDFSNPTLPVNTTYEVYFEVDRLDTFLLDLRIVDNDTEPFWWRSQLGTLSKAMAPYLSDAQRRDAGVQDFLFSRYFKNNTFGVFIDIRVFRSDFQLVNEYFDIIYKVKPTYKSFIVYENDLRIITFAPSGNTYTDPGILDSEGNILPSISTGVKFNYRFEIDTVVGTYPTVGMGLPYEEGGFEYGALPVQVGMAIEDIGSAYDIPNFGLTYTASEDAGARSVYIIGSGEPLIVGASEQDEILEVGQLFNERTYEYTQLVKTEAPILNSIAYSGSGPFSVVLDWNAIQDADEYVILYEGEAFMYTYNIAEVIEVPDEKKSFSVIALFKQFLSLESNELSFPVGPVVTLSNVSYVTATAQWSTIAGAVHYLIDVSSSPTFSSFILQDHIVNDIEYDLTALPLGSLFYVRVRAFLGGVDYSQFSEIVSEETLPFSPPVVLESTEVTETGFTINWTTMVIATEYYLDIWEGSTLFLANETVHNTYYEVTGAEEGQVYSYVVRSGNGLYTSVNSNIGSVFTSDYLFYRRFTETSGILVQDSSVTPSNPGLIKVQTDEIFTFLRVLEEGSGSTLQDRSTSSNDASITSDTPADPLADYVILRELEETSGTSVGDSSPSSNDASITSDTPADPLADYVILRELEETSGTSVGDSSPSSNDASITSVAPTDPLADYVLLRELEETSGITLQDSGLNDNDGSITSGTAVPFGTDFIIHFEFGETLGTVLNDSSLNDNDGDIV